jgi:hypothetical protein
MNRPESVHLNMLQKQASTQLTTTSQYGRQDHNGLTAHHLKQTDLLSQSSSCRSVNCGGNFMIRSVLLHPQILKVLASAGHGSVVLIADGNFPFTTGANPAAE